MNKKKGIASVLIALLTCSLAIPANAASSGDYRAAGVNIRNSTGVRRSRVLGAGYPGQRLTAYCEEWNYAENSGDWFYHQNRRTRIKGYSLGRYLRVDRLVPHGCY